MGRYGASGAANKASLMLKRLIRHLTGSGATAGRLAPEPEPSMPQALALMR